MAEQTGATKRSALDQAAADGSITDAPARAVDPVPVVPEPVGATVEGVDTPAPVAGARRRLSPRPVPFGRRRRAAAAAAQTPAARSSTAMGAPPATDEEPTPAEEMDDVATQEDKATGTGQADIPEAADKTRSTTATKSAKPKTAAEIVAEQRAREKAAATPATGSAATPATDSAEASTTKRDDGRAGAAAVDQGPAADSTTTTAVTKPVSRVKPSSGSGSGGTGRSAGSAAKSSGSGRAKAAVSTVGSGVRSLRNLLASLIWLAAVLAAAVLALGALFTALDQTNQSNQIVEWVLARGNDLVGPFKDVFRLETAKNTLLVNWGIAALVYLIAGKILERFVRP